MAWIDTYKETYRTVTLPAWQERQGKDISKCTCFHHFHWHFEAQELPSGRTGCAVPHCNCKEFKQAK